MNLCRFPKNGEPATVGNSAWTEIQEDGLASLLSTLSQLESEKRHLSVQLEAAQEALFAHQNKTRNLVESLEEDIVKLKDCLANVKENEDLAGLKISALEKALEDMQQEKQTVQKRCSSEAEANLRVQDELRKAAEKQNQRLSRDLELKTEENIGLRMTILKVQEDLSRENHLQEKTIEDRNRAIQELTKTLSEIRLERDARIMDDLLLTPVSDTELNSEVPEQQLEEFGTTPDTGADADSDVERRTEAEDRLHETQEEEILRLREENYKLRSKLRETHCHLQLTKDQEGHLFTTVADELQLITNSSSQKITDQTEAEAEQELQDPPLSDSQTSEQQQCDRLRRALRESQESAKLAQDRADHVTYLLNQKLIELNKLQLTLSSQTKDMIQLEKAYFQLKSHLGRGFRSRASPPARHDLTTTLS